MKVFYSYDFYKNDKKIGEYINNQETIDFKLVGKIDLNVAAKSSLVLAEYYKKPVRLFYENIVVPYSNKKANIQDIVKLLKTRITRS